MGRLTGRRELRDGEDKQYLGRLTRRRAYQVGWYLYRLKGQVNLWYHVPPVFSVEHVAAPAASSQSPF